MVRRAERFRSCTGHVELAKVIWVRGMNEYVALGVIVSFEGRVEGESSAKEQIPPRRPRPWRLLELLPVAWKSPSCGGNEESLETTASDAVNLIRDSQMNSVSSHRQ